MQFKTWIKFVGLVMLLAACKAADDPNSSALALFPGSFAQSEPPSLRVPYDASQQGDIRIGNIFVPLDYLDMGNTPFGKAHLGLHFTPRAAYNAGHGEIEFFAMADGIIEGISTLPSGSVYTMNILVRYNNSYSLVYQFEPNKAGTESQQALLLNVAVGGAISQGTSLGKLLIPTGGVFPPELHTHILKDNVIVCPEPYFEAGDLDKIKILLASDTPTWKICY